MKEDILKANQSFYKAFANGDHEAMDALWARKHAVSVIHPGWGGLHGLMSPVMWYFLMAN